MHLVHNERVKLLAGALNTLGIAIGVTGAVAPTLGVVYGTFAVESAASVVLVASACFVAAIILHLTAQAVLGRLRDG